MARKRARAREMGLCAQCCRERPDTTHTICAKCHASNAERVRNRRNQQRGLVSHKRLLEAYERAGDVAREHDFHAAAAQHYQDALNAVVPVNIPVTANAAATISEDHDRISEKLIQALFLSGDSDVANPLYDHLLNLYLATPGNSAKAVDTMLKIARQLWFDSKTSEALPIIARAIQLAEKVGERSLWIRANLIMHSHCVILGRYDEATRFLNNIRGIGNEYPASLHILYYGQKAVEAAISGKAIKAYKYFDQGLLIAENENDLFRVVTILQDCAYSATILGDIDLAKSHTERALFISRQRHFLWLIPFLCLEYARILAILGQTSSGYGYLLEALSSGARTSVLERSLAETGIPLALQMSDEMTLAKCARPSVVNLVFQSREPENIGAVAAVFAKLYASRGDRRGAQALLHRAVEAVSPTSYGWQLPLEVARQGASADVPRARTLLEARAILPRSAVARGCLSLFDAHVAYRENRLSMAQAFAKDALERFEALRWHTYADEARSLLPYAKEIPHSNRVHNLPFTEMHSVLTIREQQVASFVLQGLTNRAIATELSITENTVEKHMTSIMNRLGIRSRHQLADSVESTIG